MKKIVVLMSTYNGEQYVENQIESILAQEGCEVELLVRDDMSSDNTTKILDRYKNEGKLKWFSDGMNLGPAKSFLSLMMQAPDAEFYAFADQDDVWYKNKLCRGIEQMGCANEPLVYYANAELVDKKLKPLGSKVYTVNQPQSVLKGLCSCNALGCTMIFNYSVKQAIVLGGMPDKVIMHDGYVCGVCVAMGGHVIYDDCVVMQYRQHENNAVGANGKLSVIEWLSAKIHFLCKKNKVSVSEQCDELLKRVECVEPTENLIKELSVYQKKWPYRIDIVRRLVWLVIKKEGSKHELIVAAGILIGNK